MGDDDSTSQLGSNLDPLDHDANGKKGGSKAGGNKKKSPEGMPERTWILVEENDDIPPTGLYVGHNGTGYLLRAGEPISVPSFLLDILDHAIMTAAVTDPTTRQVIGQRQRMRYPYRRVAAPDGQE